MIERESNKLVLKKSKGQRAKWEDIWPRVDVLIEVMHAGHA